MYVLKLLLKITKYDFNYNFSIYTVKRNTYITHDRS